MAYSSTPAYTGLGAGWSDSTGSALVRPDGSVSRLFSGSTITAALVGDSHQARHYDPTASITNLTALGQWNWANTLLGCPFTFRNYGWSGDTIAGIAARASAVPRSVQVVILNLGTNDMLAVSSGASAGTVTTGVNTALAAVSQLVSDLVSRGKKIILTTIYPNNALTPGSDARISWLNQVNAGYVAMHNGSTVWVVDSFVALRDSAAPTLGTATANYLHSDGTHLSNLGGQVAGVAAADTLRAVASQCLADVDIYAGWNLARGLYTSFRTGTGGTAGLVSYGAGTLGDGWRFLAGGMVVTTPASDAVLTNVAADAIPAAYINRDAPLSGERTQVLTVANVSTGGTPTIRTYTDLANTAGAFEGPLAGGSMFCEYDVELVSPVNVTAIYAESVAYPTLGTAPADQGYSALSGGGQFTRAMTAGVLGVTAQNIAAFRGVIRTPAVRIPENISTIAVTAQGSINAVVAAGGSFQLRVSAPRVYLKHYELQ